MSREQRPIPLIDEAVAGNLDVATAKAKIRQARASYRQSAGTLFPTVDGSGSATRSKTAATTEGGSAGDGVPERHGAGYGGD